MQNFATRICAERFSSANVPCRPMALRHAETTFCRAELRDADEPRDILKRLCTLQTNGAAPCRNTILPRRTARRASAWRLSQSPMYPADQWRCAMQKRHPAAQSCATRRVARRGSAQRDSQAPMCPADQSRCAVKKRRATAQNCTTRTCAERFSSGIALCRPMALCHAAPCKNDILIRRIARRASAWRDSQAPKYPAAHWRCVVQKPHSASQKCATQI